MCVASICHTCHLRHAFTCAMHICGALLHFLTSSKLVCRMPYAICHSPLTTTIACCSIHPAHLPTLCCCLVLVLLLLLPQLLLLLLLLTISHAKSNEQFMGFMTVPLEDAFLYFTFLFVLLFSCFHVDLFGLCCFC